MVPVCCFTCCVPVLSLSGEQPQGNLHCLSTGVNFVKKLKNFLVTFPHYIKSIYPLTSKYLYKIWSSRLWYYNDISYDMHSKYQDKTSYTLVLLTQKEIGQWWV